MQQPLRGRICHEHLVGAESIAGSEGTSQSLSQICCCLQQAETLFKVGFKFSLFDPNLPGRPMVAGETKIR